MNIVRTGGDRNRVTLPGNIAVTDADANQRAGAVEIEHGGVAEILYQFDLRLQPVRHDAQRARANADHHLAFAADLHGRLEPVAGYHDVTVDVVGRHQVHGRVADEAGDIDRVRPCKNLSRRADLLDLTRHEHRHAVGERHRLFLVVGDVDRGHAQRALQLLEFGAGFQPEL